MPSDSVHVRRVEGRYPYGPAPVFRCENIEVTVEEVARVVRVRVEDAEHPDMWLEITLEVER